MSITLLLKLKNKKTPILHKITLIHPLHLKTLTLKQNPIRQAKTPLDSRHLLNPNFNLIPKKSNRLHNLINLIIKP